MRETSDGIKRSTPSSSPAVTSACTPTQATNESINVLMKYSQFAYSENGEIASDASSATYLGVPQDGTAISVSTVGFTQGTTILY